MSGALPDYDLPCWDSSAEAIGEVLLHERAQFPPIVLGQCEMAVPQLRGLPLRCPWTGFLHEGSAPGLTIFLCPGHGADLGRAVRRWPR